MGYKILKWLFFNHSVERIYWQVTKYGDETADQFNVMPVVSHKEITMGTNTPKFLQINPNSTRKNVQQRFQDEESSLPI